MGGVRARLGHVARAERRLRERERGECQSEARIRAAPRLSLQLCTGGPCVCAPQAKMVTSVLCILMCGYNYFLILELGSRAHILYAMKILTGFLTYLPCPFLNNTISTKSQAGFSGYHESLTCEVSS